MVKGRRRSHERLHDLHKSNTKDIVHPKIEESYAGAKKGLYKMAKVKSSTVIMISTPAGIRTRSLELFFEQQVTNTLSGLVQN